MFVACPLHKRQFSLEDGECLNDAEFSIITYVFLSLAFKDLLVDDFLALLRLGSTSRRRTTSCSCSFRPSRTSMLLSVPPRSVSSFSPLPEVHCLTTYGLPAHSGWSLKLSLRRSVSELLRPSSMGPLRWSALKIRTTRALVPVRVEGERS